MKSGLSKLFRRNRWKPRNGVVYKNWYKGDTHLGKSATVKIIYNKKEQEGTFRISNRTCEIRIGKGYNKLKLFTPVENVVFQKKIKQIDTIWKGGLGQNGYYGKDIQYTAKVLDSKKVEETH